MKPCGQKTEYDDEIKTLICLILNQAKASGYRSVILPALGIDRLDYLSEESAGSIFKHVNDWLSTNPDQMTRITFVVCPRKVAAAHGKLVL